MSEMKLVTKEEWHLWSSLVIERARQQATQPYEAVKYADEAVAALKKRITLMSEE